jgi:hypothetical protein
MENDLLGPKAIKHVYDVLELNTEMGRWGADDFRDYILGFIS